MEKVKIPKNLKKLIKTKRINLKPLPKANFEFAQFLYEKISEQRQHFKFLPMALITKPEEEYNFLLGNNKSFANKLKVSYGLYHKKTGDFMGVIGVHALQWEKGYGEFGVWIFKEYAGNGYVSEAIKALEDYLFGMGFHKLVWKACTKNAASCKVAKKAGYVKEGVERQALFNKFMNVWEDHAFFGKLYSEWTKQKKNTRRK